MVLEIYYQLFIINMIKPAIPKIASTIGLSGLSAGVSHGVNKALNKKRF